MRGKSQKTPSPFYWLRAGGWDDLWQLVPEFEATLNGTVLCSACALLLRRGCVTRLVVHYARPKVALMGVYPAWHAVRLDFFKILAPIIRDQSIHVGDLALRDGTACSVYRFLELQNRIHLRGGPKVIVDTFKCGHHNYRYNTRKVYFLRRDVDGLDCVADGCSLYVSEQLLRRIQKAGIRGLRASPITILDHPLDGLPEVLPD